MQQVKGTINTGSIGADLGQEKLVKWVEAWTAFMVDIWVNRIDGNKNEFGVKWDPIYDTVTPAERHSYPHLRDAVFNKSLTFEDPKMVSAGVSITFQMPLYGLYVDMGVGREFGLQKREGGKGMDRYGKGSANSMGGKFLPEQPGLKKTRDRGGRDVYSPTREARPWFSQAYGRSVAALVDRLEADIGFNFARIFDDMAKVLDAEKKKMKEKSDEERKKYAKEHRKKNKQQKLFYCGRDR